jgi:hypothetical protein
VRISRGTDPLVMANARTIVAVMRKSMHTQCSVDCTLGANLQEIVEGAGHVIRRLRCAVAKADI